MEYTELRQQITSQLYDILTEGNILEKDETIEVMISKESDINVIILHIQNKSYRVHIPESQMKSDVATNAKIVVTKFVEEL